MAGFQVTLHGRFWVITEAIRSLLREREATVTVTHRRAVYRRHTLALLGSPEVIKPRPCDARPIYTRTDSFETESVPIFEDFGNAAGLRWKRTIHFSAPCRLRLQRPKLPATIYGNNEITCGNSYSSLRHITAWADYSSG